MTDQERPTTPDPDALDPEAEQPMEPDGPSDGAGGGVRDLLKEGADAPDAADIADPAEQP